MDREQITPDKIEKIIHADFPRAAAYDPFWQLENEMGSPCLWLIEAVSTKMHLKPGMRVLDLGCGNALTSIFLAKEYGVRVYATDLWVSPSDNLKRIRAAGVEDLVCPIHGEAHALPYADDFFDAMVSINSLQFFGTADTYFNEYLGKLAKPGAEIGIAVFGIQQEFDDVVPDYLQEHWRSDFYYFHSLPWWSRYFRRTGTCAVQFADDFDGKGAEIAVRWEEIPDRMRMIRADRGRNLTWLRLVLGKQ